MTTKDQLIKALLEYCSALSLQLARNERRSGPTIYLDELEELQRLRKIKTKLVEKYCKEKGDG
jgi:hypothetical protein